jgi:hypothetical protein
MTMQRCYTPFRSLALFASVAAAILGLARTAAAATNVVCIGEQTTSTAEVASTWPKELGTLLGATYTVRNDGDGSATLLQGYTPGARYPFNTPGKAAYTDSIGMPAADIVIIGPWAEHDSLQATAAEATVANYTMYYETLIGVYQALASKPTVYITNSIENSTFQAGAVNPDTLVSTILNPAATAAAVNKGVTLIDLHTPFLAAAGGANDPANTLLSGDGHLSVTGAQKAAMIIYDVIKGNTGTGGSGASSGGTSGASSGAASGATTSGSSSGTASGDTSGSSSGTASGVTSGVGTTSGTVAGSGTLSATSGTVVSTGSPMGSTGTGPSSGTTTAMTGSAAESGSNSASSGSGGTTEATASKSTSGCTMGAAGSAGGAVGLLSLFGLALVGSRRRNARRSR